MIGAYENTAQHSMLDVASSANHIAYISSSKVRKRAASGVSINLEQRIFEIPRKSFEKGTFPCGYPAARPTFFLD